MTDTSVHTVNAQSTPTGAMGQRYLATGTQIGVRLRQAEEPQDKSTASRDYETVGYVLDGRAELHIEGQKIVLEPGDSWVVPKGAEYSYAVLKPFTVIDTTCPPAQVHGRDEPPGS